MTAYQLRATILECLTNCINPNKYSKELYESFGEVLTSTGFVKV